MYIGVLVVGKLHVRRSVVPLVVEVAWFRSRRKVDATTPPKGARTSEATLSPALYEALAYIHTLLLAHEMSCKTLAVYTYRCRICTTDQERGIIESCWIRLGKVECGSRYGYGVNKVKRKLVGFPCKVFSQ
jgi:hypothetical protein